MKQIEGQKELFPFIQSVIRSLKWFILLFGLVYLTLFLSYFNFFSIDLKELFLQVLALLILLLGLPLSAGFRVDQLSLSLGGSLPREAILVVASLVTWLNLFLIAAFRKWLSTTGDSTNTP